MKTKLLSLIALLGLSYISGSAQTVITETYVTGFDNTAEQAGWVQYRKGDTGPNDFNFNGAPYSPTKALYHGYPVGGSVVTIDWFVSKAFDFSAGGKIDSLRNYFSGFGTPTVNDTVAIYLLKGSADPALATSKTLLFDFRGNDYMNDNTWRKLTNVNIPATAGQCYIGFKYKTISNWLDVKFDNLAISASHTAVATGIAANAGNDETITLFPNPAGKVVSISAPGKSSARLSVSLYNILGERVLEKNFVQATELITDLPQGTYFYQVSDDKGAVVKSGKLILQ